MCVSMHAAQIDDNEQRTITTSGGKAKHCEDQACLMHDAPPRFYGDATTACVILRPNGGTCDCIGKDGFDGSAPWILAALRQHGNQSLDHAAGTRYRCCFYRPSEQVTTFGC